MSPDSIFRSSTVTNTRSISDLAQTTSCERLPHSSAARMERSALACKTRASSAAANRCWTSDACTAAIITQLGLSKAIARWHGWMPAATHDDATARRRDDFYGGWTSSLTEIVFV